MVIFQLKNAHNVDNRKSSKPTGETTVKYIPKNKADSKSKKSAPEYTDYEEVE